jgi:hypothetical protein
MKVPVLDLGERLVRHAGCCLPQAVRTDRSCTELAANIALRCSSNFLPSSKPKKIDGYEKDLYIEYDGKTATVEIKGPVPILGRGDQDRFVMDAVKQWLALNRVEGMRHFQMLLLKGNSKVTAEWVTKTYLGELKILFPAANFPQWQSVRPTLDPSTNPASRVNVHVIEIALL